MIVLLTHKTDLILFVYDTAVISGAEKGLEKFFSRYNTSHAFVYAMYGVICLLAALFVWKLVPETKGKTLEQITTIWRDKKAIA